MHPRPEGNRDERTSQKHESNARVNFGGHQIWSLSKKRDLTLKLPFCHLVVCVIRHRQTGQYYLPIPEGYEGRYYRTMLSPFIHMGTWQGGLADWCLRFILLCYVILTAVYKALSVLLCPQILHLGHPSHFPYLWTNSKPSASLRILFEPVNISQIHLFASQRLRFCL